MVKVYVPLRGVQTELLRSSFTMSSLEARARAARAGLVPAWSSPCGLVWRPGAAWSGACGSGGAASARSRASRWGRAAQRRALLRAVCGRGAPAAAEALLPPPPRADQGVQPAGQELRVQRDAHVQAYLGRGLRGRGVQDQEEHTHQHPGALCPTLKRRVRGEV